MPIAGDGFVDVLNPEGKKMAADLSDDSLEMLLDQSMGSHDSLMQEHRGNAESAHSIVRHSAARKFNQEDPIEAASAEMILQKNKVV